MKDARKGVPTFGKKPFFTAFGLNCAGEIEIATGIVRFSRLARP
jgi:hypothetical protein